MVVCLYLSVMSFNKTTDSKHNNDDGILCVARVTCSSFFSNIAHRNYISYDICYDICYALLKVA